MKINSNHFIAIIGGAVAGSVAAAYLAERGFKVAVFEQGPHPYGKIEDGLPKWHVKLRWQEKKKIDQRLSNHNIFFIPRTKIGRDIPFPDLIENWGFTAVLLANGAWKDRPLPLDGADAFIGKGLIYQNDLVKWFNHSKEIDSAGNQFKIPDNTLIIGGGLASLDVVKIVMLETVLPVIQKRGINIDLLQLEHSSISKVLQENHLTLPGVGLKGCTLFYRRRVRDMPLTDLPGDAAPEKTEKFYQTREKIFRNFQDKFLFNFQPCRIPTGLIVEEGRLLGLKFKKTEIMNGTVQLKEDPEQKVRGPLVISSIGSIPEPIPGIPQNGELYKISNTSTGQLSGFDNVFALGNVISGKGNIKTSSDHGIQVAEYISDSLLAWTAEDYEKITQYAEQRSKKQSEEIVQVIEGRRLLPAERIISITNRLKKYQKQAGYRADYGNWIKNQSSENKDGSAVVEKNYLPT